MIRFRNPGVQFSTQIQVLKELYINLKDKQPFTLDDMATVIAQGKLMTAYGYAGTEALKLSNTEKESMNSAKMNAKMYAEVFRMLGWVTPSGTKSYPLEFTYIGAHIALADGDSKMLYEQCVLGINNPTELSVRLSYNEQVRFFKCVLRSFVDLDEVMYKHEFCLGPMSVDDINDDAYKKMIENIKSLRGDDKRLKKAFTELAKSLGMKETPVDNCTRIPVALLKSCGLAEEYSTKKLYPNRTKVCLKITTHGKNVLSSLMKMKDLRLDEFNSYDEEVKMALIRLGIFSMLKRADYNIEPVKEQFEADEKLCEGVLDGKELLFSPYQTIRHDLIDKAMGFKKVDKTKKKDLDVLDENDKKITKRDAVSIVEMWELDVATAARLDLLTLEEDRRFLDKVHKLLKNGKNVQEIVDYLFKYYRTAKQDTFYPLISTLFKIMGFECSFSRAGDNGARWDAIIDDIQKSIPIEIKSPTEEENISIKAIRQALENKIILLSRKTHATIPEVTSLAVGYCLPNDRAEVGKLIKDFKKTYNVKIGVIDLRTLLKISISILVEGVGFDKEKLYSLEGIIGANS
ncbi:hypothetical protein K5V21_15365 [Clostridium sardiniense]|uniref:AlwI restriction endonuclease n=1 Tax=Clostridium sardiniense TaxID=29369 RepID=A0ABS7L187_CLOSR|nr:hypothetical protein [Clostridium sardiniense]MBY0756823.1 hypothetical protein [Clostridium sardiniense]MDQ0458665.1 hypothetical protein [Clostridium sardiniense]